MRTTAWLTGSVAGGGEPSGQRPRAVPELGEAVAEARGLGRCPDTSPFHSQRDCWWVFSGPGLNLGRPPCPPLCTPEDPTAFTQLFVHVREPRLISMSSSREAPDGGYGFLATDAPWKLKGHVHLWLLGSGGAAGSSSGWLSDLCSPSALTASAPRLREPGKAPVLS